MSVRAKVQLQEIRIYQGTSKTFVFRPIYDTSTEENARFTKYTPSGEFTMLVDNPSVDAQFEIGKYYYADFIPCDK